MSFLITQGYGVNGGGSFTGTLAGTIPDYSCTNDTYVISVDSALSTPISIIFDQEITGLLKSTQQQ